LSTSRITAINVPLEGILAVADRVGAEPNSPARDNALRLMGVRDADAVELGALLDAPVAEAVLYARAYDASPVPGTGIRDLALRCRAKR
jgi:hypothetical protein